MFFKIEAISDKEIIDLSGDYNAEAKETDFIKAMARARLGFLLTLIEDHEKRRIATWETNWTIVIR